MQPIAYLKQQHPVPAGGPTDSRARISRRRIPPSSAALLFLTARPSEAWPTRSDTSIHPDSESKPCRRGPPARSRLSLCRGTAACRSPSRRAARFEAKDGSAREHARCRSRQLSVCVRRAFRRCRLPGCAQSSSGQLQRGLGPGSLWAAEKGMDGGVGTIEREFWGGSARDPLARSNHKTFEKKKSPLRAN